MDVAWWLYVDLLPMPAHDTQDAARTSELSAQALSRCSPSQIGPLIDSWSHFEAARFLSESVAATPAPDVGSFNGDEGGTICDHINDTDGLTPTSGKVKRHDMDHLAKSLMSEGMEPKAVATVLRALTSSGITGDISSHETPSTGDHDTVESDLGLPRKMAGTRSPRRAAEGALRLLLLRTFGECSHSPSAGADAWTVVSNRQLAVKEAELVAATSDDPRVDDLYRALDVLCLHLAKAELHSAVPVSEDPTDGAGSDDRDVSDQADAAAHGTAVSTSTVLAPGVEFGVGPIERGVGYALVAADGRAVLAALRALLEEAEGTIKELRESRETDAANGDGRVVEIALEQVGKLVMFSLDGEIRRECRCSVISFPVGHCYAAFRSNLCVRRGSTASQSHFKCAALGQHNSHDNPYPSRLSRRIVVIACLWSNWTFSLCIR